MNAGLDFGQFGTILGAIAALLAIHTGVVFWAVKNLIRKSDGIVRGKWKEMDDAAAERLQKITEIEQKLAEHRVHVAEHYLSRTDWLVGTTRMEKRLDSIGSMLYHWRSKDGD